MKSDFDRKVARMAERLKGAPYPDMEAEAVKKMTAWFQENRGEITVHDPPGPREAYELLMADYLGIPPGEAPVVSETEDEIVWLSSNRCPTLEACLKTGLETREVCRAVCEKPAQVLISKLDPRLRFYRSYEEIRPHSPHCREMVVRMDFEKMMVTALEEAASSREEGNKGYGAVVALGKRTLARAHDTATTEKDPSLHAEVNAIRRAVRSAEETNLCGGVLFSTCEPCPMCASLAVWANLTAIVYGASIEETAGLGRSRILIGSREIIDRSPVTMEVIGGVLEEKCRTLYT